MITSYYLSMEKQANRVVNNRFSNAVNSGWVDAAGMGLGLIPGVGQIASAGLYGLRGAYNAATGQKDRALNDAAFLAASAVPGGAMALRGARAAKAGHAAVKAGQAAKTAAPTSKAITGTNAVRPPAIPTAPSPAPLRGTKNYNPYNDPTLRGASAFFNPGTLGQSWKNSKMQTVGTRALPFAGAMGVGAFTDSNNSQQLPTTPYNPYVDFTNTMHSQMYR